MFITKNAGAVMNTIPTIFNQRQINYSAIGGTENVKRVLTPVTCLVLNRSGGTYRSLIFDNLLRHGFESIIMVCPSSARNSIDEVSRLYPTVKFLIALEEVTIGDMLNMGMAAATGKHVLVLQDDMCTESILFTSTLAKKLIDLNQFCICPKLISSSYQSVPVHFMPEVTKSIFKVEPSVLPSDNTDTFYAADWAGLYDRERFIQLGGVDYTIESPYWQKADLFFRAWLWGEKTTIDTSICLTYSGDLIEENQTVDYSYLRFYLKNLLPVYKNDHAEIPLFSFFVFNSRSSCPLGETIALFKDARRWTSENKYRFKCDAVGLVQNWGKEK